MLNSQFNKINLATGDGAGSSTVDKDILPDDTETSSGLVDIFGKDDKDEDKEIKPKEEKEEVEVDKEIEKEDELELKEEEEDEDKIDLKPEKEEISIDAPPKKKEILAKYPKFFQEFPFMEKMLYRDKQYSELFGSFDDAKEAYEKVEEFSKFETQLLSGKTEDILKTVKDSDNKAFAKIVDDYLPTLARVDQQAYLHVVGNVIKYTIMEMVNEAKRKGDDGDPLREAALLLNQFVFMNSEFEPPKRLTREESKDEELEEERSSWIQERFESSVDELQTKTDNVLKNTINEYIDPKDQMTSYIKRNAIKETLDSIKESISNDNSFRRQLDRLWEQASRDKFSKSSLDKIRSAYLGKAKTLLKPAMMRARAEALKDLPPIKRKDSEEQEEREERSERRGVITPGRERSERGSKLDIQKDETITDYFMRD